MRSELDICARNRLIRLVTASEKCLYFSVESDAEYSLCWLTIICFTSSG